MYHNCSNSPGQFHFGTTCSICGPKSYRTPAVIRLEIRVWFLSGSQRQRAALSRRYHRSSKDKHLYTGLIQLISTMYFLSSMNYTQRMTTYFLVSLDRKIASDHSLLEFTSIEKASAQPECNRSPYTHVWKISTERALGA